MNQDISKLLENLKKNPKVSQAIKNGDISALINNPEVLNAVHKLDGTPPPEALKESLLNTPQGQQVKKILEKGGK